MGLAMIALWLCIPHGCPWARKLERGFHRLILAGHGIEVRVHGKPSGPAGTLFVANHVSWIDIPLLAALLDAAFVAKDDVARWPVLGALARRCGTLFVARDRPRLADTQWRSITRELATERGVILFPEGTTSNGDGLLPFRTSLFAAARMPSSVIQPVAIVYCRRDGTPLSTAERRAIAWLDNDALLPHAFALARRSGFAVDVYFETPVVTSNRKLLAELCRQKILARLGPDDQAAMLNRVA